MKIPCYLLIVSCHGIVGTHVALAANITAIYEVSHEIWPLLYQNHLTIMFFFNCSVLLRPVGLLVDGILVSNSVSN